MFNKWLVVILLSASVIGGCSSTGESKTDEGGTIVEDHSTNANAGTDTGASTSGLPANQTFQGDPLDNPSSPLATRVIYFEYDSSEITADYQESVLAHGGYLAENPDASVTLEGHTDERGSREYNIGLGERRAQAVRRLLLFQGASDKQVVVVSYGEEKPVAEGRDEMNYGQNRRVEIIYKR
ncbi:MAG: peptidoglycan-associated lipoprotein Pal [Gammaproteobacteria bacterium]|nr:peptidoglycan-associated lipoprotein Pal [Gammaproteobacteria bacterium]